MWSHCQRSHDAVTTTAAIWLCVHLRRCVLAVSILELVDVRIMATVVQVAASEENVRHSTPVKQAASMHPRQSPAPKEMTAVLAAVSQDSAQLMIAAKIQSMTSSGLSFWSSSRRHSLSLLPSYSASTARGGNRESRSSSSKLIRPICRGLRMASLRDQMRRCTLQSICRRRRHKPGGNQRTYL